MTKSRPNITAIIIAKNEAQMIVNCIDTLSWCDEVVVIDSGSSDDTVKLAETAGARVIGIFHRSMAKLRNEALKRVKTDWVFYIDADERVTPTLAKEIMVQLETNQVSALSMRRQNVHYGKIMEHGGWNQDWVIRVFAKDKFSSWVGPIHESPEFKGQVLELKSPLIHLTHRHTVDGLKKTIAWTPIEAELLAESDLKPIKIRTIFRKGFLEFLRRAVLKRGYRDGAEGWIEALVQGLNRMLVYIQVWEHQRQPSLEDTYRQIEERIATMWQAEP